MTLKVRPADGVLHVPSNYDTIQAAIDDAIDGETVEIQPGTYLGPGNKDLDLQGKEITVRSIDPNDPNVVARTIIDCNEAGRAFYFYRNEKCYPVIAGLTITNGHPTSFPRQGGAICSYFSDAHPIVINCILTANSASAGGGAAACYRSGMTLHGCIINANSASSVYNDAGGGIYAEYSDIVLTDCTITDNTAAPEGTDYGGETPTDSAG